MSSEGRNGPAIGSGSESAQDASRSANNSHSQVSGDPLHAGEGKGERIVPGEKPYRPARRASVAVSNPQPPIPESVSRDKRNKTMVPGDKASEAARQPLDPESGPSAKSQEQAAAPGDLKGGSKILSKPPVDEDDAQEKGLLKNKFSDTLKVIRLANPSDEKQKEVVLATLAMTEVLKLPLKDVKKKLKNIDETDTFCFKDHSPANDSLLVEGYLHQVFDGEVDFNERHKLPKPAKEGESGGHEEEQKSVAHKCFLYLTPKPVVKATITAQSLALDKFAIKVFEWSVDKSDAATSRGNLQSSKLGVQDARMMTLAGLRKKLATCTKMSVAPKTHQFCTKTGESVVDETMTFLDYLQLEETLSDPQAELPSVHVYYKLAHPKNEPLKFNMDDLPGKLTDADKKLTGNEFANAKSADVFASKTRATRAPEVGTNSGGAASNPYALDASYLTEMQWAEVLRNCGVMYGWVIDRQKNEIIRAPKPAFQLRPKLSEDEVHSIPDVIDLPKPESRALPQITDSDIQAARAKVGDWGSRTELKGRLPGHSLKTKVAKEEVKELKTVEAEPSGSVSSEGNNPTKSAAPREPEPTTSESQATKDPIATIDQVNDDSKIEVTVSSHEFETSMAKNDFSNSATEGSLSAGYGGFAANINASREKETSKSDKKTYGEYEQTIIAKFMLPRADLVLHPSDLEPTPELKAALERIRVKKNIADLRKLNQDFGQLWCQRVTVGGRLQSTKIMADRKIVSEQAQKEVFKAAVGAQVTTPWGVGGGMKHSNSNGTEATSNSANETKRENNVFEAVGGDTILAARPDEWSSTVADYRTWRVINVGHRQGLPQDAISAIPGYASVRSWFMQAVPTLSRYIELPPSREINLRFKLTAPTNQLSLSYLKSAQGYDASGDPIYYLGHSQEAIVRPLKNDLVFHNNGWAQWDITDAEPLFSPQSYRAPVLLGYSSNLVGTSPYGSEYSQDYTNSLWKVSAPFNDALSHGALVSISTVPLPQKPADAGGPATVVSEPLSLVVFRNQQSVFLPGLSDSSDRHFWRILKHGAKTVGEHIQEGDEIYFAWAFQDQTTGFRDFSQDVFGRRRTQFPSNVKGRLLYMKLPWPRFEPIAKPTNGASAVPNTMMLSDDPPVADNKPQKASIKTAPGMAAAAQAFGEGRTATDLTDFGLQDVRFRIDVVGNDGYGESGDQLLKGIPQTVTKEVTKPKEEPKDKVQEQIEAIRALVNAQNRFYEQVMFLGR